MAEPLKLGDAQLTSVTAGLLDGSNLAFVNIFLKGRNLMPNVAVWFPEEKYDFFRVQEPPISLPCVSVFLSRRLPPRLVVAGCRNPGRLYWMGDLTSRRRGNRSGG